LTREYNVFSYRVSSYGAIVYSRGINNLIIIIFDGGGQGSASLISGTNIFYIGEEAHRFQLRGRRNGVDGTGEEGIYAHVIHNSKVLRSEFYIIHLPAIRTADISGRADGRS